MALSTKQRMFPYFTICSSVSIVNFEKVNADWDRGILCRGPCSDISVITLLTYTCRLKITPASDWSKIILKGLVKLMLMAVI